MKRKRHEIRSTNIGLKRALRVLHISAISIDWFFSLSLSLFSSFFFFLKLLHKTRLEFTKDYETNINRREVYFYRYGACDNRTRGSRRGIFSAAR